MDHNILTQRKGQPSPFKSLHGTIVDFTEIKKLTMCLVEGNATEETHVLILASDDMSTVVIKSPLDDLLLSTMGMAKSAQGQWAWSLPEDLPELTNVTKATKRAIAKDLVGKIVAWAEEE